LVWFRRWLFIGYFPIHYHHPPGTGEAAPLTGLRGRGPQVPHDVGLRGAGVPRVRGAGCGGHQAAAGGAGDPHAPVRAPPAPHARAAGVGNQTPHGEYHPEPTRGALSFTLLPIEWALSFRRQGQQTLRESPSRFGFALARCGRASESVATSRAARERMSAHTLQTLRDPILLAPVVIIGERCSEFGLS
jgi:hypothetical protein